MMETDTTALSHWRKVVELIQAAFWEILMAKEYMFRAMVLITMGGGDYRGIGLVEVVRKLVYHTPCVLVLYYL